MAVIHKTSKIIRVQIGEVVVGISPLSHFQKIEIQGEMLSVAKDRFAFPRALFKAVKYSVKTIEGITDDETGEDFELEFEDLKTSLTDKCCNDLLTMEGGTLLQTACLSLVNKIPEDKFLGENGEEIEGIKILKKDEVPSLGKKKSKTK